VSINQIQPLKAEDFQKKILVKKMKKKNVGVPLAFFKNLDQKLFVES